MVESVDLTPIAWCDLPISGQVKPKQVEHSASGTGGIARQILIHHWVRLDSERNEPFPPGNVVFVDGLHDVVDLLEIEVWVRVPAARYRP